MPKLRDPERGFVASANSTTDPHNHAVAFTSTHCEPRYRMARIESVLASAPRHGTDSFAALQRDVVADYAPPLRDALVRAVGTVNGNAVAAQALDCWRAWDGSFSTDSGGALLYALVQQDLPTRLFVPLLGADLGPRYVHGRRAMPRLHQLLLDPADLLRADIERAARRSIDELVRESFFAAVNRIAPAQGADPSRWRLGAMQRVWLGTAFSLVPVVGRRFVALDDEFPGDEYTVSPSRSVSYRGSLYAVLGATSRFICDLATPDEALFAHSAGPSTDPGSTFFANLSAPWHRFEYFRSALWKPSEVPQPIERLVIGQARAGPP
jgi:acyl-homoserine lactone acylase PvdQ